MLVNETGIRSKTPTTIRYRGRPPCEGFVGDCQGNEPLDCRRLNGPTRAVPGSDEKVAVLMRRYEFGLPLFHPADVQDRESDDRFLSMLTTSPAEAAPATEEPDDE